MAAAAKLIRDDDVVTVNSSSGLGCPDAMLAAIGARFGAESHLRNLTLLRPIAAGDMYGIKGVDHIVVGEVPMKREGCATEMDASTAAFSLARIMSTRSPRRLSTD